MTGQRSGVTVTPSEGGDTLSRSSCEFPGMSQNLVLFLYCRLEKRGSLLEKLRNHKVGKSCLYLNKLEDVHIPTLAAASRCRCRRHSVRAHRTMAECGVSFLGGFCGRAERL